MRVRVSAGGADWEIELGRSASLAIETSFAGEGPSAFGAAHASSRPLVVPGFSGSVTSGASCNCSTITLTPHCNATHTECAGHLTSQPLDALRVVPVGLLPAVLLSVTPERAKPQRASPRAAGGAAGRVGAAERAGTAEQAGTAERARAPDDLIITGRLLEAAWPRERWPMAARALVLRTLPNDEAKRHRDYTGTIAPYLAAEAARSLVERGIEHLVVDFPSIDRIEDEGRLAAHRVFFGLPPGATDLTLATRAHCTITELAYVPDAVPDGEYLLELQIPALTGDAVPSRPLLYSAERITQGGRIADSGAARKRGRGDGAGARRKRARAPARRGARSKHGRR